ncbi:MAG: iron ABC transporter permease [Spirochaetaceae bacterium]|jgi:iron complex transport system permease protein|nr:iron ABC transporter permease [Spirochaetaceae bacterium]
MKKSGTDRNTLFVILLAVATAALGICALGFGRFSVSIGEAAEVLSSALLGRKSASDPAVQNVILLLRLPRITAAILVGAALALSGSTYQSIFKNPLAAPELLGVFQGSCVGAAAAILLNLNNASLQFLALAGGVAAVGLTVLITRFFKNDSTAILVLAGVIVSGLMRSILGLLKYVMDSETQLPSIVFWELGSLADITAGKLLAIGPPMLAAMFILLAMRWQFNLLSLGDKEAESLGVNLVMIRGVTIICSTILTSCAVCLSGTIAWIGLVIPHVGRLFTGADNIKLSPAVIFTGAIFLVVIDTASRSISGFEIPLSILTGIIGAPLFIFLIFQRRMRVK